MTKKYILALISLSLLLGIISLLDYRKKWKAGYCFAENRLLTDNELVDLGVKTLLKNLDREYESLSTEEQNRYIKYQDLNDFYERQPRCCGFSGDGGKSKYPRPPSRILVKDGFLKSINYQIRLDGDKKFRTATVFVSFCGDRAGVTGARAESIKDGQTIYHDWVVGKHSNHDPNSVINKSNIRGH